MTTTTPTSTTSTRDSAAALTVVIVPNDKGNPPGKLADAELHFEAGPLAGLKFIGFAIWERRTGGGRNVTLPARTYQVNGERRSFSLLRPIGETSAQDRARDLVLRAFEEYEGPRTSTRITFDHDGQILEQNGQELTAPAPQPNPLDREGPADPDGGGDARGRNTKQAISYGSISAADAIQEASTSPNPDPAILMRAQVDGFQPDPTHPIQRQYPSTPAAPQGTPRPRRF